MQYIAFDSHKRYTYAVVEDQDKGRVMEQRIAHRKGEIREFLSRHEPGSPVALETIGSWYWIVDEIEAAGMLPRLVNARKAKMMLASSKKDRPTRCQGTEHPATSRDVAHGVDSSRCGS